ncbi:PREDICTED: uncharacterized protein LOC106933086 [Poecilia mexicana]|uniref:uncharacterized protein LOC106933086 n=1 Tax=Poecilia mexicana TaxID=48701 RepID=UPI00072E5D63|nr:PREDICTED: uncharacterized protein LOC106933086 [Poecilia mexicana]
MSVRNMCDLFFFLPVDVLISETDTEMDHADVVYLVMWLNIRFCLPVTVLVIGLCCMVRLENIPVIKYMNLLVSNLVQFGSMIVWVAQKDEREIPVWSVAVYYCSVMASLGFRVCITLERYFVIVPPKLQCIRQPISSALICFMMWGVCFTAAPFLKANETVLPIFVFVVFALAILSAPVMVFCLARSIRSLPAATSVSTEEKRRVVGVLVFFVVSYTEMILSTDVWSVLVSSSFLFHLSDFKVIVYTFLLNPFMDLVLFVFMCKGPIDKLLGHLCCCSMEHTADKVIEEIYELE